MFYGDLKQTQADQGRARFIYPKIVLVLVSVKLRQQYIALHCNESPKMVEPMYESNIRICVLQILNHATICSKIRGGDILSGFCNAYFIIFILRLSLVSCWCNFKQSCYQPEFSCSILGVFTASQAPFILR